MIVRQNAARIGPNEKEISHGWGRWQARSQSLDQGRWLHRLVRPLIEKKLPCALIEEDTVISLLMLCLSCRVIPPRRNNLGRPGYLVRPQYARRIALILLIYTTE